MMERPLATPYPVSVNEAETIRLPNLSLLATVFSASCRSYRLVSLLPNVLPIGFVIS